MSESIQQAVAVLLSGGVIAYPTEYSFGIGCDPASTDAIQRILDLKQRRREQGLILIAADQPQVEQYADLEGSPMCDQILQSWPGPVTWVLPAREQLSEYVTGCHKTVAIRIPGHPIARQLCAQFGSAIISTSANRHAQMALCNTEHVRQEFGPELDYVVDAAVGDQQTASRILDGTSGKQLR